MTKKTNLAEALGQFSTQPARAAATATAPEKPRLRGRGGASHLPPSRQGKKTVAGFFDTAVSTQLKQIGLDENKTVQDLLAEAINDLFKKYKKPPIA